MVLGLIALAARATSATRWIVEADPLVYLLGGGSLHARASPLPHWTFGFGGGAGLELPAQFLEAGSEGSTEDWKAEVPWALAVSFDRSLRPEGDGWSVGAQTGLQHLRLRSPDGKWLRKGAGFAIGRIGWRWRPFAEGLHLFPWIGIGWTRTVYGNKEGPSLPEILPFGALHVGWQF